MTEREEKILKGRLVPEVKKVKFHDGNPFKLERNVELKFQIAADMAENLQAFATEETLRNWHVIPRIEYGILKRKLKTEGYEIHCSEKSLTLFAATFDGLRHAFRTLRQLAEPQRGVEYFEYYILPPCEIQDWPDMKFRGIHICWFPEQTAAVIEKEIRLAAYMKYNYAVIEFWGQFPFKSHPEMCFHDAHVERKQIARLLNVARDVGITLIPQLNIFGHASMARSASGKHAALGAHPELASLFEPDGWCWCLTNPETKRYLTDMMDELLDFFDNPPFFHAGCDEADGMMTCAECRKHPVKELVGEYLRYFHDTLAERGVRMLMWHDMLIEKDDPQHRWDGYICNGRHEDDMDSVLKSLPRDIIMCDWQYGLPKADAKIEWPITAYLKKCGFDVLVSPWLEADGAERLIRFAGKSKLLGALQTTWHRFYTSDTRIHFILAPNDMWNAAQQGGFGDVKNNVNLYMRQIDYDMDIADEYDASGICIKQIKPVTYPHW